MKAVFFKVVRPINECLHPPLCSFMISWIINTKWRVFDLVYYGHSWDLCYFCLPEEQVVMRSVLSLGFRRKVSFLLERKSWIQKSVPPPFVALPSIYKIGKGFLSSFLSNDGFVSHHYFSSTVVFICHLSCCHFFEMGCLTSDTELINNAIIAIMSFRLTVCGLRLWSTQPQLSAPFLRMTSRPGKRPSLTASEVAPRRSGRSSFTILVAHPQGLLILGENHQSWDLFLMIRSHGMMWTAQLASHTTRLKLLGRQRRWRWLGTWER